MTLLSVLEALGVGGFEFGRDVLSSLRALSAPGIEAAGDLHTRQEALSQLIALAVLADGEVTDAEAKNLRHLFRTSDRFTGDPDGAVARLRECARRASTAESLESTIVVVATDLDPEWKEDAFRFVAILALRGAGLRGSGFGTAQYGFRQAPMSDPDGLLKIFARALKISPEVREDAIRRAQLAAGARAPDETGSGP